MTPTVYLVRQSLRPSHAEEAANVILDHIREDMTAGVGALLPQPDVWTTTLFIERGEHGPALWWYVELSGEPTGQWTDPVGAIQTSPLFTKGLSPHISDDPPSRVFGPDRFGSLLLVHARHPNRPSGFDVEAGSPGEPEGEWKPATVLAEEGPTSVPDVVFVRWKLRRGPATWFMHAFARFANWLDPEGWLERKFTKWSEPVLEEEDMWTETGFLEGGLSGGRNDRTVVLGVMETAEMKGVEVGFYQTDNLVARVSERVLGWIIENPEQALQYEALQTDFEPLVHAVNPDRV